MQLLTDFPQYYDGIFDGSGPVFHRMAFSRGGLSKRRQFAMFEQLGFTTPPHGPVSDLVTRGRAPEWLGPAPEQWLEEVHCVVYVDELLHGGQGKVRLSLAEAARQYPETYASIYSPPVARAVNFRHVRLGGIGVWLRQTGGANEWKSNRGDTETVLERTHHSGPPPIPRVLWAIDFIPTPSGLCAIDFNTAPELVTLGETGTVSPDEIRAELEKAAAEFPSHLNQF